MKVLTDGICLTTDMKGVGRYLANTLTHLSTLDTSFHFSVLVLEAAPPQIVPHHANFEYIRVPWWNHLWHGYRTLPKWIRQLRPDLILVPYETPVRAVGAPYTMVCHDVPRKIRQSQQREGRHFRSSREYVRDSLSDALMAKALRGAKLVFSNSRYVADWLETDVGVKPWQIRHAPCAPGADFHRLSRGVDVEGVRRQMNAPRGYVLTFSTGDARENFGCVLKVFSRLVNTGLSHTLVIAGVRDRLRANVESCLSQYPWRNRVRIVPFLGVGGEQELAGIYTAASVYLDPSLHEGFGMQVIEAMACGTPVVCSNRGALPEVTSGAALLVNPLNVGEIADALIRVLSDESLRMELLARGYQRSESFSWATTAKVIYQGLLHVAGNR